jgi:hypothetical protein
MEQPIIVGISGFAGSGKDTVADFLAEECGFVKVAFADPLKRVCKDVYDFTDDQLWGPSQKRNEPDKRYPRDHKVSSPGARACGCCGLDVDDWRGAQCYLTPRYALQLLGTEWGRHCYPNTWVDYALRVADRLVSTRPGWREGFGESTKEFDFFPYFYDFKTGLLEDEGAQLIDRGGVVIPDVRFINEMAGLKQAKVFTVRVRRKGYEKPAFDHPSETEQLLIPDEDFDYVFGNTSGLEDLRKLSVALPSVLRKVGAPA